MIARISRRWRLGSPVVPSALARALETWRRLGLAISRVTTVVGMAVLFVAVFTPIAIVLRFRRRAASRPEDVSEVSAWIERCAPADPSAREFDRPF